MTNEALRRKMLVQSSTVTFQLQVFRVMLFRDFYDRA